jgi:hypothetical protein
LPTAIERDEITPRIVERIELKMIAAWNADLAMQVSADFINSSLRPCNAAQKSW